jgi:hypothetical protein
LVPASHVGAGHCMFLVWPQQAARRLSSHRNFTMNARYWIGWVTLSLVVFASCLTAEDKKETKADEEGFVSLYNGKDFTGWKINENEKSWSIEDGAIKANGNRSHLFYVGDEKPFKNFELRLQCMTRKGSNGGVYFHTKYQAEGWPKFGFEAQVNQTQGDVIKTGSIYKVKDNTTAPVKDDEWFDYTIRVEGKHITTAVNGKTIIDYTEPDDAKAGNDFTRVVDQGTFAFQAHDPGSTVYFKNIRVKRLD